MKFTEEIYSHISFIEIIVIIVKEHLWRSCNKCFSGICIFKMKRLFLRFAGRFFSSATNSAIFVTCNKH